MTVSLNSVGFLRDGKMYFISYSYQMEIHMGKLKFSIDFLCS